LAIYTAFFQPSSSIMFEGILAISESFSILLICISNGSK
jgi:hypothetical protein